MEIDAQAVINKLTNGFAGQLANMQRDKAISDTQIEMMQSEISKLESENERLRLDSQRSIPNDDYVDGTIDDEEGEFHVS